jgi:3-hydroxyisobutyrate dehydrogenase-like beta-hydroxyacid dehydrogenase
VEQADYILSIVPPRDALSTAERICAAAVASANISSGQRTINFLDLNAVSPQTARQVASAFERTTGVTFIDGVISGGVPHEKNEVSEAGNDAMAWHCPTLLLCGPERVQDAKLQALLNMEHMSDRIGAATAVKMCFGMTTKGFIALAIQAFTTAHRLGVLDELQEYLGRYKPATLKAAQEGLVRMPHTAYRWFFEMLEMSETAAEYGGFDKTLYVYINSLLFPTYRLLVLMLSNLAPKIPRCRRVLQNRQRRHDLRRRATGCKNTREDR